MKNLKFGVFFLGLAAGRRHRGAGLSAQDPGRGPPGAGGQRQTLMILDGRGSQLGVMVSDLDPKAGPALGVKIDEVNPARARPRRRVSKPAMSWSNSTASASAARGSSPGWCRRPRTAAR